MNQMEHIHSYDMETFDYIMQHLEDAISKEESDGMAEANSYSDGVVYLLMKEIKRLREWEEKQDD